MITSSMTYKQMYDHFSEDLRKVKYRMDYFLPKAIREFRKARHFPAWKWYEYKVPETNNRYIICYYAEEVKGIETPKVNVFADVFFNRKRFVVKWGASAYRHTPSSPLMAIRQIHAYTSHFLHRYNERFLKDTTLSSNDIACRYLSRNDIAMPIEINEEVNMHIEEYGEGAKHGYRVRDGFCFTNTWLEGEFNQNNRKKDKVDAMVIVYTTFMTEYDMADSQRLAIFKEHCVKWRESFLDFMREADNGVLTLKLEP